MLRARVTDRVPRGTPFATVHYPEASINLVVGPHVDRPSHVPEYKVTSARLKRA